MNRTFDIAVVGAGAAGIAAAVTAARSGCATILLDERSAAGGTGGFSGLTTLCGLYDEEGNFLNEGFSREFAGALADHSNETRSTATNFQAHSLNVVKMGRVLVLRYQQEAFRAAAADLLGSTPHLKTSWSTPLAGVDVEASRIVRLNGFDVGAVIDCSGSAQVAGAIGEECLKTDETTQSPAILFLLLNVQHSFTTPAATAQVLLPLARAGFPPLSFQSDLLQDRVTVKFTGRPDQVKDVIAFLQKNISGFENCHSPQSEFKPTQRSGRMIIGRYLLTGQDVLSAGKFPDAVARCAWPIEQWGADGTASFRYLAAGTHYEIPARSLQSRQVPNLFMAGKTISADTDAIGSARVMGCCLATGEAAAVLAANFLDKKFHG